MAINSLRYSALNTALVETVVDQSISASVCTMNSLNGNIGYISSAPTSNFTLNITNVGILDGTSLSITLFVVQGATGYIPNALQIDGSAQTIKWAYGTAPTPTSSTGKIDVFSFTLIRRSSAWTVLGSAVVGF